MSEPEVWRLKRADEPHGPHFCCDSYCYEDIGTAVALAGGGPVRVPFDEMVGRIMESVFRWVDLRDEEVPELRRGISDGLRAALGEL